MTLTPIENLEESLRALGKRANFSFSRKQAVRDRVFRMIGQVELADAIIEGKQKASVLVSLRVLKRALLPDKISFSMPVTVAMMMLVFVSSIVTGALAQGANPADALFPVKKVLERIELAFISNPVSKAKVTLNIADDRIRHLGYSVNNEATLVKVLQESQLALVNAKSALQKISAQPAGDSESDLVNKLTALLNDQKEILNSIDKKDTSADVKKVVVAIRETLDAGDAAQLVKDSAKEDTNSGLDNSVAVKPTNVIKPETIAPLLQGRQTITGRLITSGGQPAIYSNGRIYLIKYLTINIDLSQYIGTDFVVITGDIVGNEITAYQIAINGKVVVEQLPLKS